MASFLPSVFPTEPSSKKVPQTTVRTSHALTIRVNGGSVGLINSWNPSQARTVTPIYELGVDTSGNPIENMPGNVTGLTINVNRYDTYPKRMEEVFGTSDLVMLTRQSQPFDIYEVWRTPAEESFTETNPGESRNISARRERFVYRGCWFTSLGRTLSSDDNRIVNVNATLIYTQKLKVTGIIGNSTLSNNITTVATLGLSGLL